MCKNDELRKEIEKERKILDEMLLSLTMEDAIAQSQKLDCLIERYIDMAN